MQLQKDTYASEIAKLKSGLTNTSAKLASTLTENALLKEIAEKLRSVSCLRPSRDPATFFTTLAIAEKESAGRT